jgi:hypothetical protein
MTACPPSLTLTCSTWTIDEQTESFIVKDATGQALAHVYFEDAFQRQTSTKRLSHRQAAERAASNIEEH